MSKKTTFEMMITIEVPGEPRDPQIFFKTRNKGKIVNMKILKTHTREIAPKVNERVREMNWFKKFIKNLLPGDYKVKFLRSYAGNNMSIYELYKIVDGVRNYTDVGYDGKVLVVEDEYRQSVSYEISSPTFTEDIAAWWAAQSFINHA